MRTQLVDGLFADLLQVVRFLRVYKHIKLKLQQVVYLQFALIATNRLKPGKVSKVIFAWIKVILFLHFLCQ